MKKITFILTFLIPATIFAQNVEYEALQLFMTKHPNYVSFKDRNLLDPKVNAHYEEVKTYLASINENIEEYYLDNSMVLQKTVQGGEQIEESWLRFPVYHINTMYAWLKFKNENPKRYNEFNNGANGVHQMVGNASGKDVDVEVNYTTGITKFVRELKMR